MSVEHRFEHPDPEWSDTGRARERGLDPRALAAARREGAESRRRTLRRRIAVAAASLFVAAWAAVLGQSYASGGGSKAAAGSGGASGTAGQSSAAGQSGDGSLPLGGDPYSDDYNSGGDPGFGPPVAPPDPVTSSQS